MASGAQSQPESGVGSTVDSPQLDSVDLGEDQPILGPSTSLPSTAGPSNVDHGVAPPNPLAAGGPAAKKRKNVHSLPAPGERQLTISGLPALPKPTAQRGGGNAKRWVNEQFEIVDATKQLGKCKHCHKELSLKNGTRSKLHLLNKAVCKYLDSEEADENNDPEVRELLGRGKKGPQQKHIIGGAGAGSSNGASKRGSFAVDAISPQEQRELQRLFAEMVYLTNLPFSWVSHPAVLSFFERLRPAFKPPSAYQLTNTLLLMVYLDIYKKVQAQIKQAPFVTITCDGWSKKQGDTHVLGFHAAYNGSSVFLDMKAEHEEKITGTLICDSTVDVIKRHKLEDKVSAYVSDTPSVMKAAWRKLQDIFPLLLCLACLCHVLDLFLKDLAKLECVAELLTKSRDVVKYFKLHAIPGSILDSMRTAEKVGKDLEMFAKTRFATNCRMLASLLKNERPLKMAVVQGNFPSQLTSGSAAAEREKASLVADIVLDEQFWTGVRDLSAFLTPFADAIYSMEDERKTLGDAYYMLERLSAVAETVLDNALLVDHAAEIMNLWEQRKDYGWNDAYVLGALLDPKYHDIIADIPPSRRVKAEELCVKLAGGGNKGTVALSQLSRYRRDPGKLGIPEHAFSAGLVEEPIAWWADYGGDCASLAAIAQRINGIPVSSAGDERAWRGPSVLGSISGPISGAPYLWVE